MSELFDRCLAVPGKNFPEGYGFALAYLDTRLNPMHLRDAACAVVGYAYGPDGCAEQRKSEDLARFVSAYSAAKNFEDYAIEAAQLCFHFALVYDLPHAKNGLAICGHPGYPIKAWSEYATH